LVGDDDDEVVAVVVAVKVGWEEEALVVRL
jgi:hypothetical protein